MMLYILALVAALAVHCGAQNVTYTVTPTTCSGSGACGLERISNGAIKPLDASGACPTGYQQCAANTTYCEKPCPSGYTTSYITSLSWRKEVPTVMCTKSDCPTGYTTCPAVNSTGGICLPPQLDTLAGTSDLCTAFTSRGSGHEGSARSCGWTQTAGSCTEGTAVCVAPAMVSCLSGYQLTPDSMTCIKCPAGMNVTTTAPYTCNGTCNATLVNGTCYGNCSWGGHRHGGRCYHNCTAGGSAVNATTCAFNGTAPGGGRRGGGGGHSGGGTYYQERASTSAPVLKTSSKPLDKRGPKIVANCPVGMSYCGSSKCASNIYSASGCSIYASQAATVPC